MPSRVLVWVRLPRLPLEFWLEDILHKIASLLGNPAAVATQTLDKKFCHEYGHLLRQCPKVRKEAHSPSSEPPPMGKEDKGKAPMMDEPQGKDKEGFVIVKTKARGQRQKRTFKDRQTDGGFNRFEVLENLDLEKGVPHVVTSNCVGVSMEVVPILEQEPIQAI